MKRTAFILFALVFGGYMMAYAQQNTTVQDTTKPVGYQFTGERFSEFVGHVFRETCLFG